MKNFFILLGILMVLAFSCSTKEENSLEIPSTALALEQESGKLAFAHSASITERAVARYMVNDVMIFNNPSILPQSVNIENMELKKTGNGKAYLFFTLKAGGSSLNVASELNNESDFYTLGGETHTCTGNSCSSCGFTYDSSDNITGCKCNNSDLGECNHSVTRTDKEPPVIGG